MFLNKKIILHMLGYLILSVNTIAANHISPNSNIILGEKIYINHCKVCHGNQGDGKTFAANVLFPPPKNFLLKNTKAELTLARMILSVVQGRPNTAMMPWENILSEEEIVSVVSYIRKELMKFKD